MRGWLWDTDMRKQTLYTWLEGSYPVMGIQSCLLQSMLTACSVLGSRGVIFASLFSAYALTRLLPFEEKSFHPPILSPLVPFVPPK